jgi:hypothetical protein
MEVVEVEPVALVLVDMNYQEHEDLVVVEY